MMNLIFSLIQIIYYETIFFVFFPFFSFSFDYILQECLLHLLYVLFKFVKTFVENYFNRTLSLVKNVIKIRIQKFENLKKSMR